VSTSSTAPGSLEELRELANSWRIPNDTRRPCDEIGAWAADAESWSRHFAVLPRPRDLEVLLDFRDVLRAMLSGRSFEGVERFLEAYPPKLGLDCGRLVARPCDEHDIVAVATSLVVSAATAGTLPRLRTCPDCGWAFYDSSRNGKRVWCAMVATMPGGRGCGSATKARAYRQRLSLGAGRQPIVTPVLGDPMRRQL
jgi:predicted RNA-binding Zn ribbon-like protein